MIRMPRISSETAIWSVVGILAAVLLVSETMIRARAFSEMIEAFDQDNGVKTLTAEATPTRYEER
ncbi:hypothetical protein [Paracoccus sp. T5]|uniref:hypothetical protein n=1 Tax=Paracoccus sp. T5 TaxID=3402161 RepID=UPI003ADB3AE7